ncbi:MAG: CBS domain-containing protein [Desulfurococcales archaeon]|nr:CBS domain-containing protein [Desulfurococcales archaeon]
MTHEELPVISLVTKTPIVFKKDATVAEAIRKMAEENIGSVVIVDDEMKPIGIFTERDLLLKVCAKGLDPEKVKLEEVMTPHPMTIKESESAKKALEIMIHFGFRHLPVVDSDGRLVGIISIKDVSRPFAGDVDIEELHAAG